MSRTVKKFTLPAGAGWKQAPSESERAAVHRDGLTLVTGYRLVVMEVEKDPHPKHLGGRSVILALWTDTGERRGIVGFPVEDWSALRDAVDAVVRGRK